MYTHTHTHNTDTSALAGTLLTHQHPPARWTRQAQRSEDKSEAMLTTAKLKSQQNSILISHSLQRAEGITSGKQLYQKSLEFFFELGIFDKNMYRSSQQVNLVEMI